MPSESDLMILGRAALAALLGLAIGWERQVTGSAIKARTIGLAALTAACLTALGQQLFATGVGVAVGAGHAMLGVLLGLLVYVIIAVGEWPVLSLLRRRR